MKLPIALAIALLAAVAVAAPPVSAQTPSPSVEIVSVAPFRNIIETGDIYFMIRGSLPLSEWCSELEVTTGCPSEPEQGWNLDPDKVEFALYSGCAIGPPIDCSTATEQAASRVPRIGQMLGGIYMQAGHPITWAQADVAVCLQTSAAFYSPTDSDCFVPLWNSVPTDETSQRDALAETLLAMLRGVEFANAYPVNSLVNGDSRITASGAIFANEALNVMSQIVPDIFQTGVGGSASAFVTPTPGGSNIQTRIDATATASGLSSALDNSGKNAFGMSGPMLGMIGIFSGGAFFAMLIGYATRSPVLVTETLFASLGLGIWVRAPTVATLFALIVLAAFPAAWWVAAKMRQ